MIDRDMVHAIALLIHRQVERGLAITNTRPRQPGWSTRVQDCIANIADLNSLLPNRMPREMTCEKCGGFARPLTVFPHRSDSPTYTQCDDCGHSTTPVFPGA